MTARSKRCHLAVVAGLAWLTFSACTDAQNQSGTVEILNWWTEKGEADALQALLNLFGQEHPRESVINTVPMGSTNARATIKKRMIAGQPPDTFQANGGWDLLAWVLYNGRSDSDSKMRPIDDLYASESWTNIIPGPVLDTVSFNHHAYAVPLNIHRENTLYYNKGLFAAAGVTEPPATLDDLFAVAAVFQAKGITPFALGTQDPWTLPLLLFENILVARAGGAYYHDFFLGRGNALAPEISTAVDDLSRFLAYTNADASTLTWSDSVDLVGNGGAAMVIMGDWAKGHLLATLSTLDNIGEVPMPGTTGTFVFTTDTFGLPMGASNREGARDLLRLFGSKEGQDTFNPLKGSISARSDANTQLYDTMAQRTIAAFQNATSLVPSTAILAPPEFMDTMNNVLAQFAGAGDATVVGNRSFVLHTLDNWSDVLRSSPWH
jgi:glucose/mannose transport system substrate-binding protein